MISILLPTRNRPQNLKRMVDSVRTMSTVQPEIVVYIDDDDTLSPPMAEALGLVTIIGPRIIMTDYWNKCYEKATSDIVMQMGDDVIFKTPGWDVMVEEEFAKWPDKIVLVHGDDIGNDLQIASYPFLHRRWAEVVGYFSPPYFVSGGCDVWINAVAKFVNRRQGAPFFLEQINAIKHDVIIKYSEQYINLFEKRLADCAKLQEEIDQHAGVLQ